MVEDLIKRLRDTVEEEPGHGLRNDAADLIEQQAARLTALESERDALLAAAGKEAVANDLGDAARDVIIERQRQMSVEGWTPEHDDEHEIGELARAAACYAANATGFRLQSRLNIWPWDREWWKPTTPRRDLVKAGALIIAEIERIDRAAASAGDQA
jgi:hypothetical protein